MQTDNNRTQSQDSESIKNEIERDIANYTAAKLAVENTTLAQQRDQAMDRAALEAEQRAQAEQHTAVAAAAATLEADQRAHAEQQASMAHIREQQARQEANRLATERSLIRESLASEREAASNANFGFVFLVCIVLAALIGLGIWYYTSNTQPGNATQTSSNSSYGQPAATEASRNQSPPPVIVKDNPSLVVVPVPSTPTEANRVPDRNDSAETRDNTAETAPPPDSSEPSETGNPDAKTTENPNGSTSDNTNPENTPNSADG